MEHRPQPDQSEDAGASGGTTSVPSKTQVTQWLAACKGGDREALESLLPIVYDELHRQAIRMFSRERAGHTLQPTALVNEVYLRLVDQREANWQNRAQFFALAAQMMRRILVSHARSRRAAKRGGSEHRITLEEGVAVAPERDVNLLALDERSTAWKRSTQKKAEWSSCVFSADYR
jgi:RNA polymerase sigma-70 factor (ECF subfamily)